MDHHRVSKKVFWTYFWIFYAFPPINPVRSSNTKGLIGELWGKPNILRAVLNVVDLTTVKGTHRKDLKISRNISKILVTGFIGEIRKIAKNRSEIPIPIYIQRPTPFERAQSIHCSALQHNKTYSISTTRY